jgi:excisionase family DNA binding protein
MELLTVQETAQILKVTPITVRRFIAAGRLTAVKAGKGVRVYKESIEQLIRPIEPQLVQQESSSPRGRPLTFDDPLWEIVGSATDAEPTDASKKYEYLAEALAPTQP